MRRWLLDLPFLVTLMGIGAAAMMVPAAHAAAVGENAVARAFFYSSLLFLILFVFIAIATSSYSIRRRGRSHLIALVAVYTVLPVMLAVPFYEAVRNTAFINAYFEMVSSLTTTGASMFEASRLQPSVHLWRALVGWMGGFLVWVTAIAVLAPLNLGGFEVRSTSQIGAGAVNAAQIARVADGSERLQRFAARLFPVYAGLTALLWGLLIVAGDTPLVAICHAMSTLSTSGISPIDGVQNASSGFAGEALVVLFLVFALTRVTFAVDERQNGWRSVTQDPELRMALIVIAAVSTLMFVRHWLAALDINAARGIDVALTALWGGFFMVVSFLTTTGFESSAWGETRVWSGLQAPGLILMGLAIFGGGVGTTAGGVKLLRVYALYKHGMREMEKLVHPSSIGGAGPIARHLRRQGAYVAWIFFMLFAMSIALVMGALSLAGQSFEPSLILTIAALSTTGPLIEIAGSEPLKLVLLSDAAKGIVAAAMVLGRLETLALIALLNPDFWRN